ncbi:methionyl-tRNA formyltransferase [Salininema proteolyticum]|uniref:Methionyl-tRNA formyltransferase n=1 Tax=Salininema proteolyticum TaxID=1607685 RepID=A0ABV8U259_9ACTN
MNDSTRLALVTGHEFGRRAFEGILSSEEYLAGRLEAPVMIGLPSSRAGGTVGYRSIADLAEQEGSDFHEAGDGSLIGLSDVLSSHEPHFILVIGWSRLVHPEILALPEELHGRDDGPRRSAGCVGMHPTRLPDGRGQAPIPWTVIKGRRETALSVFFLEAQADTGPLIAQHGLEVRTGETASSLFHRFAQVHGEAGSALARQLAARSVPAETQADDDASRWPKRRPDDGRIDHMMSVGEVDRLVRALLGPYPRAFAPIEGRNIPVRRVRRTVPGEASTVAEAAEDVVRFGCRDGVVELERDDRPRTSTQRPR